jgi:L,D-peptidoglycan transpeptidase YkuD (ErfK/YbiS/YcfS/YnhG family)
VIYLASADGWLDLGDQRVRCALGPAGVVKAAVKREGDGASPAGIWPIRRVLYRPDQGPPPETALPIEAIAPDDGWCDAPDDPAYNRPVKLPYPASAEHMWRDDRLYDLVVVHLAKLDYAPTHGCVAVARADLEALLRGAKPGDAVEIKE